MSIIILHCLKILRKRNKKIKTNDIANISRSQSIILEITIIDQIQRLRIETPQVIVEASRNKNIEFQEPWNKRFTTLLNQFHFLSQEVEEIEKLKHELQATKGELKNTKELVYH
jgi:hypothetical protein